MRQAFESDSGKGRAEVSSHAHKAWIWSLAVHETDVVAHTCNPRTLVVDQNLKVILGYIEKIEVSQDT